MTRSQAIQLLLFLPALALGIVIGWNVVKLLLVAFLNLVWIAGAFLLLVLYALLLDRFGVKTFWFRKSVITRYRGPTRH